MKLRSNSKKADFLIAAAINVLFFIVYVCVFQPLHETNDDLAISFFVEGAYGTQSEYLVYQNVIWGKFLILLYQLVPQLKWYNILMYTGIFSAFLAISYSFIRLMGRKMGVIVDFVILLFFGFHTYTIFQYTRIAALITAGGLVLLLFAVEKAESKIEKRVCLIVGALLALWGSMLRFQMFALSVVLVLGSTGIYRVFILLKEKKEGYIKRIGTYVAVFGVVGVLSLGLYVVDRLHYSTDEKWSAYTEFNELRTELWDYGMLDYTQNVDVYDSLGISQNDYWFYLCWNMDAELLTTDDLQVMVDAKEEKTFTITEFLQNYPSAFLKINLFVLYLVISVVAIGLNRKNIFFALYGFLGVMAFEAYFFMAGRHGIPRVDYAMWMAAVIGLVYGMSDDVACIKEKSWKWVLAVVAAALVINVADFGNVRDQNTAFLADNSKLYYDYMIQDKNHLYVMTYTLYSPYFAFDFWEPTQKGELSNIYNLYGWEWNVEAKDEMLERWGITNIYRDAINNEKVYFVATSLMDILQLYIQENYDPNAQLVLETYIYDMPVFSIRSY